MPDAPKKKKAKTPRRAPANGLIKIGEVEGGDGQGSTSFKIPVDREKLPPPTFGLAPELLPAEEVDRQREYFIEQRLRAARIPRRFINKTLDGFKKGDRQRRDLVAAAKSFVTGFSFEEEFPLGLRMHGSVGCGKTHLAVAILREIVSKGYSGLFYNSPDVLRDIRATFNQKDGMTEDELLEEITSVDLLVLDDLGAELESGFVLDRFYLIINKRYEGCKPMIVTTNLDDETLRNRLGARIVSRFVEMCSAFAPFPEADYRMQFLDDQRGGGRW